MIKRLLLLGAFALAAGGVVRFLTAPLPAVALPSPDETAVAAAGNSTPLSAPSADLTSRGHWEMIWTRATPDLQFLSLSPDGSNIAWVDHAGSVRRMAAKTGDTIYRTTPMSGINYVSAGLGGCVIAASRLNPVNPSVRVFDGTPNAPQHITIFPVNGAVWTMSVAEKGDKALVGTGRSHLVMVPLPSSTTPTTSSATPTPQSASKQMDESGIPGSIDISANDQAAIVGTWQSSGVCAWDLSGRLRWRHADAEPNRTFEVHVSADGSTAVAISSRQPAGNAARIHVWDMQSGRLLWRQELDSFDTHALISANGDSIAVSFAQQTNNDGSTSPTAGTIERKVVLFDRQGHRKFADKGGMFFSPQLIALSRDGSRITVCDNSGYIWNLDDQGRTISRTRLSLDPTTGSSPTIKDAIASNDASTLLIRRGDGQITLFRSTSR